MANNSYINFLMDSQFETLNSRTPYNMKMREHTRKKKENEGAYYN